MAFDDLQVIQDNERLNNAVFRDAEGELNDARFVVSFAGIRGADFEFAWVV